MPLLPHLDPGKDRQTLAKNALALIKKGFTKGQAMALALNVAGFKPAPTSSSASPSNTPPPV